MAKKRQAPRAAGYHWDQADRAVLPCGSKPCRWCKGPITAKRRQTYCSDPCVDQWNRRVRPDVLRAEIYDRDKGACRACGLDCRLMDDGWLHGQLWLARGKPRIGRVPMWVPKIELDGSGEPFTATFLLDQIDRANRWRFENNIRGHVFEVDHVVPVVEGGDWFDPDNLQLLCLPCHRRKTSEMATRRASIRALGRA